MLLVVFSHVEIFGFYGIDGMPGPLSKLFITFRMPLFFFISGYISYKANFDFTLKRTLKLVLKKTMVQLVPTIVFGLFYTYFYLEGSWSDFLWNPKKMGYWFTISLLEMFLIYYIVRTTSYYLNKVLRKSVDVYPLLLLLLSSIMFLTKSFFVIGMPCEKLGNLFCFNDTFKYFHFFVIGLMASRYNKTFISFINNQYILALFIFLFISYLTLSYDSSTNRILNSLLEIVPRYSGLFIVFVFFYRYQSSFLNTTLLGNSLQYIGKRTLDIYMLHYFFIPHMPYLGDFFQRESNYLLELLCGFGVSICVIILCLILSNVLRISPILAKVLFGSKTKI